MERGHPASACPSELRTLRLSLGVWGARASDGRSVRRDHGQPRYCRDTAAWLHFLDGLEAFAPPGDAYLIVDALPLHWSVDTMLWTWGHPRFHFVPLPKAAAWLNLIEGFWKILGQRALAGRACTSADDVDRALRAGVRDWNRQPTPFLWGRPPQPHRQLKRQYVYRI